MDDSGKLLNVSVPWLPHLQKGDYDSTLFSVLGAVNELVYVKHLGHCLEFYIC